MARGKQPKAMTKKQLQELIDDGDILPSLFEYNERNKNFYTCLNTYEVYNHVSGDIKYVIMISFYLHIRELYCKRVIEDEFASEVDDLLKFCVTNKESKISLIEGLIKEKSEQKNSLILETPFEIVEALKELNGETTYTTEGDIMVEAALKWLSVVLTEPKIFEILKFDICKGKKINKNSITTEEYEVAECIYYIIGKRTFQNIYKNIILLQQIRYLQQQIKLIDAEIMNVPTTADVDINIKKPSPSYPITADDHKSKLSSNVRSHGDVIKIDGKDFILTIRNLIFSYTFKHEAELKRDACSDKFPFKSGLAWWKENGQSGRWQQVFPTTQSNNGQYKKPSDKEMKVILELLKDDPIATLIARKKASEK